ncbi:hypothetical protein ACFL55_02630 [Candidatus Latescibacterota bacterium]
MNKHSGKKVYFFRQLIMDASSLSEESDTDYMLDRLGEYKVRNGKVYWKPPSKLDKRVRQHIQMSIRELNILINKGSVYVDENGNVSRTKMKGGDNG